MSAAKDKGIRRLMAARYRRMATLAYQDARLELRDARMAKRAGEHITFIACISRFSINRESAREYREKAKRWVTL